MKQLAKELLNKSHGLYELIKANKKEFLYAFLALITCSTLALIFSGQIISLLQSRVPYRIIFSQTTPEEMLINILKLSLLTGSFLSFPFALYRLLKVKTQNYNKEKKKRLIKLSLLSTLMSCIGILCAYFITIPIQLFFLLGLSSELVEINLNISSYISFCLGSIFLACLAFHLPLIKMLSLKDQFYSQKEFQPLKRIIFALALTIALIILSPPALFSLLGLTLAIAIFYWLVALIIKK